MAGDTTGVTDTEIRIGGIFYEAQFADARAGAQARIDRQNADGSIHGRQLVLVDTVDDGAVLTAGTDAARRLVEQEGVFAVGPIMTPTFVGGDYLAEQGVPFFGWGISAAWCGNDYGFNLIGCVDSTRSTTIANFTRVWAEASGRDSIAGVTMAVIGDDSDAGRTALDSFEVVVEQEGGDVVYSEAVLAPPPAVVGDYTPFATDILSSAGGSAPDIVDILATPGNVIGLAQKLRELGCEGTILNGARYDPQAVGIAALMTTVMANAPYEQTDIPVVQRTLDDLDGTNPPTPHSLAALNSYWAVEQLIQILEAVGPDLTRERFVETLNGGFAFDGQGVVADLTYPEAQSHRDPVVRFGGQQRRHPVRRRRPLYVRRGRSQPAPPGLSPARP